MGKESVVLQKDQIAQKTERIAYQIMEETYDQEKIYIAGIAGNGFLFAERLVAKLKDISDQQVLLFQITVTKDAPLDDEIQLSIDDSDLSASTVILVDDVINSGRTMIYAVRRLLQNELKSLKVATLVNRTHRRFPVHADFVGINISTTLHDNITVDLGSQAMAWMD